VTKATGVTTKAEGPGFDPQAFHHQPATAAASNHLQQQGSEVPDFLQDAPAARNIAVKLSHETLDRGAS